MRSGIQRRAYLVVIYRCRNLRHRIENLRKVAIHPFRRLGSGHPCNSYAPVGTESANPFGRRHIQEQDGRQSRKGQDFHHGGRAGEVVAVPSYKRAVGKGDVISTGAHAGLPLSAESSRNSSAEETVEFSVIALQSIRPHPFWPKVSNLSRRRTQVRLLSIPAHIACNFRPCVLECRDACGRAAFVSHHAAARRVNQVGRL